MKTNREICRKLTRAATPVEATLTEKIIAITPPTKFSDPTMSCRRTALILLRGRTLRPVVRPNVFTITGHTTLECYEKFQHVSVILAPREAEIRRRL
jgi:hypothetical protein